MGSSVGEMLSLLSLPLRSRYIFSLWFEFFVCVLALCLVSGKARGNEGKCFWKSDEGKSGAWVSWKYGIPENLISFSFPSFFSATEWSIHYFFFVSVFLSCCFLFLGLWISARRSSLGLKVALVILHLIYVGVLFLFDSDLIEKTKKEPWYWNNSGVL